MKEVPVSAEHSVNGKRKNSLKRTRIFCGVLVYICAVLAIGCLIGIVVAVMMLNFGARTTARDTLCYILLGAFVGGAALSALCAYLLSKLLTAASVRELDFRERVDSEESFFAGEGTFLTFEEKGIRLHDEVGETHEAVCVPYAEMKFISVCTRKKPAERGEWCVAVEIPVRYLAKKGAKPENGPVLIQVDAKDRLYRAIEKHGQKLRGELPPEEKPDGKKFVPLKNFYLPNRKKRKRALIGICISAALLVGAIPIGIFASLSVCALLAAAGLFLGGRSIWSYLRAKAVLGVYGEGIYWRESSGQERLFLKWGDIVGVAQFERKGFPLIEFHCEYGNYTVPAAEGAMELIGKVRKESCGN